MTTELTDYVPPEQSQLEIRPGLYLVSVPIGNVGDITMRALETLARVDILACEDTRRYRKLARNCRIPMRQRTIYSYHDRSPPKVLTLLRLNLESGASIAYTTDAGTPLISDPGYRLVKAAIELGVPIVPVPGVSAATAALTVSGLPTDRFFFGGFPPAKQSARRKFLAELKDIDATLILYEAPHRVSATLNDIHKVLGNRPVAVERELTKKFEEIVRGPVDEVLAAIQRKPTRGEYVIVVGKLLDDTTPRALEPVPDELLKLSTRDAARELAARTGESQKSAYKRVLQHRQ